MSNRNNIVTDSIKTFKTVHIIKNSRKEYQMLDRKTDSEVSLEGNFNRKTSTTDTCSTTVMTLPSVIN